MGRLRLAAWGANGISGNVLWLRSDLGITLNGSDVSAWADQSGLARNVSQGTPSKQPAYMTGGQSGKPFLRFTTADSTFLRGTWTQARPVTVFLAAVFDRTQAGGQDFTPIDGATGNSRRFYNQNATPTLVGQFATGAPAPNDVTVNPSLFHLFEGGFSGADSYFRCIDTAEEDGAQAMGAVDPDGMCIGVFGDQSSAPADCDVYEVIEYNRLLTANEQAQVRNYLESRYAV